MTHQSIDNLSPLAQVRSAIDHLNHVVPGQGPILDFIHHNTIHGFQHLTFTQALEDFEKMSGIRCYMEEHQFRHCYQQGRITDRDLDLALKKFPDLIQHEKLVDETGLEITRGDIVHAALLFPFTRLSPAQLQWQCMRGHALSRWQTDLPTPVVQTLREQSEEAAVTLPALWRHIQDTLDIQADEEDPEAISGSSPDPGVVTSTALAKVETLLQQVGDSISLGELVNVLCGRNIADDVHPVMLRLSASLLDEGIAAWHLGDNHYTSLYQAWRDSLSDDRGLQLEGLNVREELEQLPEDAELAIIFQLESMKLPREKWDGYLQRLCLESPGWTGLINWHQQNPGYHSVNPLVPRLADWLAIRLTLDKLFLNKLSREVWHCEGSFAGLSEHFMRNPLQCWVLAIRHETVLPETLDREVSALLDQSYTRSPDWRYLGEQLYVFLNDGGSSQRYTLHEHGWKLFRLCQHMGVRLADLPALTPAVLTQMLDVLESFTLKLRNQIWLIAYEIHYRDDLFHGIQANYRRGPWVDRGKRSEAQIVMCMDEREESFRRHLEELNPRIETLGAAGFFGVPMKYKALDDTHLTPLCPVVVTPAHRVDEVARNTDKTLDTHRQGFAFLRRFVILLHHDFRLKPALNLVATFLLAPVVLVAQLMHSLFPGTYKSVVDRIRGLILKPVQTELAVTTTTPEVEASTDNPRLGFTDEEQAQRTATMLRTLGLTANFAPLVAMSGHGSTSQNNPHEAAHDCGACGGRQGGPNARAFAAFANRPEVRRLLAKEGIHIPEDTWFIGLQHDTCSDALTWYDTDLIPASLQEAFEAFKTDMEKAQARSAHERCRRFYSAGDPATPEQAFHHVTLRSRDLSQVRPEYGHATNASAVIGRRDITQGLFLDRRAFLISYDPTQDPEGKILENILLTAGPVGAGINLEYYFSTINNDQFGCGTKIPHNVTGLFGVMEGTSSDLRTGLPEQMVEIHEPMRLLVLTEHKTSVLERIYTDQPALQELVGGGWLLLATKDPDSEDIHVFEPESGFVPWRVDHGDLQESANSTACYAGNHSPIAPILISQPAMMEGTS